MTLEIEVYPPVNGNQYVMLGGRLDTLSHAQLDEALSAAAAICQMGMPSVLMAKECVNRAFEGPLEEGMRYERRMFHALFATEDQKEGMDAFVNKRAPAWKHR